MDKMWIGPITGIFLVLCRIFMPSISLRASESFEPVFVTDEDKPNTLSPDFRSEKVGRPTVTCELPLSAYHGYTWLATLPESAKHRMKLAKTSASRVNRTHKRGITCFAQTNPIQSNIL